MLWSLLGLGSIKFDISCNDFEQINLGNTTLLQSRLILPSDLVHTTSVHPKLWNHICWSVGTEFRIMPRTKARATIKHWTAQWKFHPRSVFTLAQVTCNSSTSKLAFPSQQIYTSNHERTAGLAPPCDQRICCQSPFGMGTSLNKIGLPVWITSCWATK